MGATIYMYYGNSGVMTDSEIKTTFLFGDDFLDGTLDPSWTTGFFGDHGGPTDRVEEAPNTLTVAGGGDDVWNANDDFEFCYRNVTGQFIGECRALSMTSPNTWAKTGMMIRNYVPSGSGYVISCFTPSTNGYGVQIDNSSPWGQLETNSVGGANTAFPSLLRIQRTGSAGTYSFTGYYSKNSGTTWTSLRAPWTPPAGGAAADTQVMGLFTCSHTANTTCTAVYDYFFVRPYVDNEPTLSSVKSEEALSFPSSGNFVSQSYDVGDYSPSAGPVWGKIY